jgi:predicted permease
MMAFFSGRKLDRDFQQEMESHLLMLTGDNIRRGMTPAEAEREARIRLGGLASLQESHREARGLPFLDTLRQDLRYTFRGLRRNAAFTTFAILIVGLGIGASSTIFSVVNALLLRPLPFRDPGPLVWISNIPDAGGLGEWRIQVDHFLDLRSQGKSFSDLVGYNAFFGTGDNKLTGDGEPERLSGVSVTEDFFSFLGVRPFVGRLFNADECKWNGPRAVLLSYPFWKRRYASDPHVVGRTITLNDRAVTVVGVMPASFDFASVFAPGNRIDLYFPFPLSAETNRWGNTLAVIGRLRPGVSIESARAEFVAMGIRLTREYPRRNDVRPKLVFLNEYVTGRLRSALLVLACAVAAVMLIVCANLANLLLARTSTRQKEMAIRAALGAGRRRLIRQMLTESMTLSCCGAALGLLLAVAGTRVVAHLEAFNIPLLESIRIDGNALAFTLLVAIVTGLIFGLLPALQVPAGTVHGGLKDTGRGSTQGRRHAWIRSTLVVSEVAFACVLLVGAGLLIRSFLRVLDVNLGFRPERAAALRVDPGRGYSTQLKRNAYYDEILRRVSAIPGIDGAGLTDVLPLGGDRSWGVKGKGQIYERGKAPETFVRVISEGYLKAIGISLRAGRDFTERDAPSSEPVILINETLARTLWPGQNPIGQIVDQDGGRRVVGMVSDVRHRGLEQISGCEMYLPMRQTDGYSSVDLVVRTSLAPETLAAAVRAEIKAIDPGIPANEFRTLQQLVDKAVSPRRFVVILLAGFSAFALILASLGIYAVISYSVAQRTQELGIRMALGASARDLQSRIVLHTLGLAGIGMVLGIFASWMLAPAIGGLLFGVTATDPVTFFGIAVTLAVVAALAGYLPARRASRIDPMVALRSS